MIIIDPGKCYYTIIDNKNSNYNPHTFLAKSSTSRYRDGESSNFNAHIFILCRKASNEVNALCRLKSFLKQYGKNLITNSFIYSSFDKCQMLCHFFSQRSKKQI